MTAAIGKIDFPCVVKPVMSSSGKGQSVLKSTTDIQQYSTQWPAAASITAV
ncbi:MAG: Formate-dependent phosphoribosylglycinamide formyltransferase [uncultured Caballeronia sp.]|nr:MAG: Formate-dependent phosphoribosylglycinamide formyltransferase [uncultured Caballeronia sp.]